MNYEAILFDLDGVIIDTHQSVTEFWERLARTHQVELTPADFEQHIYGCPAGQTLDVLFPHLAAAEREAILESLVTYEINLTYSEITGALSLLRVLKEQNIPTALVTSGADWKVEAVSKQLNLDGLFSTAVTVDDIKRGKPAPDCYLLAAQRLQKAPERCIVFEDAISGVKAAVAAGALCVGVQSSLSSATPLLEAGARWVVPDLSSVGVEPLPAQEDEAGAALMLRVGGEVALALSHPTMSH